MPLTSIISFTKLEHQEYLQCVWRIALRLVCSLSHEELMEGMLSQEYEHLPRLLYMIYVDFFSQLLRYWYVVFGEWNFSSGLIQDLQSFWGTKWIGNNI